MQDLESEDDEVPIQAAEFIDSAFLDIEKRIYDEMEKNLS